MAKVIRKRRKIKPTLALMALSFGALIGAVFAFFSSNASFDNEFKTNVYKTNEQTEIVSPNGWKEGEEILNKNQIKNNSQVSVALRVTFKENWYDKDNKNVTKNVPATYVDINFINQGDWIRQGNYYYYKKMLPPKAEVTSIIKSVTLNKINNYNSNCNSIDPECTIQYNISDLKYTLEITTETMDHKIYRSFWKNAPKEME